MSENQGVSEYLIGKLVNIKAVHGESLVAKCYGKVTYDDSGWRVESEDDKDAIVWFEIGKIRILELGDIPTIIYYI